MAYAAVRTMKLPTAPNGLAQMHSLDNHCGKLSGAVESFQGWPPKTTRLRSTLSLLPNFADRGQAIGLAQTCTPVCGGHFSTMHQIEAPTSYWKRTAINRSVCPAAMIRNEAGTKKTSRRGGHGLPRRLAPSVDQVVEFRRVVAGDLVDVLRRQAGELLVDILGRIPARCRRCAGSRIPTSAYRPSSGCWCRSASVRSRRTGTSPCTGAASTRTASASSGRGTGPRTRNPCGRARRGSSRCRSRRRTPAGSDTARTRRRPSWPRGYGSGPSGTRTRR